MPGTESVGGGVKITMHGRLIIMLLIVAAGGMWKKSRKAW
jgi:hypothetical protein